MSTQDDQIDLTRPEFWMADPYPTLARLRATDPVHYHDTAAHPFWALTRHDDIVVVSKSPETFCSGQGIAIQGGSGDDMAEFENLVTMDDPAHKWLRALVSRGFTPGRIRTLEAHVRELTTSILDDVSGRDEIDFVEDVAALLPSYVIGELLGVPREDQRLIKVWSDGITEGGGGGDGQNEDGFAAIGHMMTYLAGMQEARRESPTDDLVSLLMQAEIDGRQLSETAQRGFFLLLEFAGNETTRNTIVGGLLALAENPEQTQLLRDDPGLMGSAAEEMLRFVSPVTHFRRTATRDAELRGRQIRQGDWLVLFYGAGNRDPEVFAAPDEFDVTRHPNPHVALGGGGPHFCLGAALGRLEIRVMFEELLRRFPHFELAGPPTRVRSNFIRGIKSLAVRLGKDQGSR
jgi:cholest-4-en-3-one 26-monooxygenase